MPKDDKRKELTQEEIDAQNEKFRTFFSTSVAQVPEEMKRRDEEKENTGSLLGKLFHREKDKEEPAAAPAVQNELPPTGEIVLGHEEEAEAGLELALEPGELEEAEPVALPTAPEAPRSHFTSQGTSSLPISEHCVICVKRINRMPMTVNSTAARAKPTYPQFPKLPKNCHSSCPEIKPAPKKQPT